MNLLKSCLIAASLLAAPALAQQGGVDRKIDPTVGASATGVAAAAKQDAPASATPATAAAERQASVAEATASPAAPDMLRPVAGVGQPVQGGMGLQPQVTNVGYKGAWMHDALLLPIITVICLLVLGLMLWAVLRYRRSANPEPSKVSHNTLLEVAWTLVPILVLLVIVFPSISLLAEQYKPAGKNAVTVKAIGHQWYWSYQYPDHGEFEIVSNMLPDDEAIKRGEPRLLGVDNRIVVPVGVPVRLLTTSDDVIHSWTIPAFWVKLDAVPGRINETSFTVEKPGVYYGQCSELCGARHGFMPITVEAVPQAQFAAWIASKGGKMPGAAATPQQVDANGVPIAGVNPVAPVEGAANATGEAANVTGTDNATAGTVTGGTVSQSATKNTGSN